VKSKVVLAAALMIFLIAASPGFGTPLFFHQTDTGGRPSASTFPSSSWETWGWLRRRSACSRRAFITGPASG